jgi:hypothetical protein
VAFGHPDNELSGPPNVTISVTLKRWYDVIPDLPTLSGPSGAWLFLGVKTLAAFGFMAAADLVVLYAC